MFNTDNSVFGFFAWWKQGLLNPFPKTQVTREVLSVVDNALCDSEGNKLSQENIDQLQTRSNLYLFVAKQKVMSRGISDAQKGLPLARVAEEVLPFNASELFIAQSDDEHIHFVIRSELDDQLRIFEASGLSCTGVAFDFLEDRLFVELDNQTLVGNAPIPRFLMLAVLVLLIGIVASALFISDAENQKEKTLEYQLTKLRQQASVMHRDARQTSSIDALLTTRDAKQVFAALRSIAELLPEKAIVDQLILSENDLLIDASAVSATQVQANLDSSKAFAASEFITTISRSSKEDRERFRLKLSISEVR
jgi:hypothetical protein